MPTLSVTISARAPLVFSERRPGGQFRPGTSFVPGAALRGSLARLMREADEATDDGSEFWKLFTAADAPLFHNAYPADRLLPATALSCKAESGFVADHRHGVFDSLIDRLCCEQLGVRVAYDPRCRDADHNGAGERVETFGGFYAPLRDGRYESVNVPTHLTTRVALNRRRKVAEEGLLYSPVVISEAQPDGTCTTFYGRVIVKDADQGRLVTHWLSELTHVGSGTARGFGLVEVAIDESDHERVAARLAAFNRSVADRWSRWSQLPCDTNWQAQYTPDNGRFFAVLLMSDAILCPDGWTPSVRLEPSLLGAAGKEATLVRCHATADYRSGWNEAWGLLKDTELVARMGSVYVYHSPQSLNDQSWLGALRALEEQGVGGRRAEGYGQVKVCDEFHRETQEIR